MKKILTAALFMIIFAGCVSINHLQWQETTMYFGMSCPDSSFVSCEDWEEFVDNNITSLFPCGFTVLKANGQWKNESGIIEKEPSRIVIIIHKYDSSEEKKIDLLSDIYKEKFHQESVLVTRKPIEVDF